jgi:cell fate (sporulation/competence/biofilm development) regulator YlbF (YheA/YmcA/DUF963 family)
MERVLPVPVQESTQSLIDHLLASEVWIRYQKASAQFNENEEARDLLEQLTQAQARLRQKQGQGEVDQAEVNSLRLLRERVQRNSVIMTYAHSQQEAISFLREINQEVSQLLDINFASFASHSTC